MDQRPSFLKARLGVGKTTLWRAFLIEAHNKGMRVASASPASGETRLAFSVLSDLLAEPLREVGDQLPAPQRRGLELALLLDEPSGEAAEQRTVLAATLSTLRLLAEQGPVLVAIDDMQWIDDASRDALAFAIRRLGDARVSILGAKRPNTPAVAEDPLETAIEQRHRAAVRRITLGPLSMSAMHDAIGQRLGVTFSPSVMQRIHETSGGNPFYAMEAGPSPDQTLGTARTRW